jgi:hypothetical protein
MRTMYDAVNPLNIPASAEMVAGYVTGADTWSPTDWLRFPQAVKVRIDALGTAPLNSDVLDVEPGNLGVRALPATATAAEVEAMWAELIARAVAWVATRHAHNLGSTCYIEMSRKNQLAQAVKAYPCVFWAASWGIGSAAAAADVRGAEVAIQYLNTPGYDVSVVSDDWFSDPKQRQAPPTAPTPVVKPTLVSVKLVATYSDKTTKEVDL